MRYFLGLLFFSFIFIHVYSQDTLFVLGGKTKTVKVLDKNDSCVVCTKINGTKKKVIYLHNLYSIKYANGQEVVVYKQDTTLDFYFTPEQMNMYLIGFRDAKKTYKPIISDISIGAIALVSPALLPAFPWGILTTGLSVGIDAAIKPHINFEKYGRAEDKNNEVYQTGFMDGAQKKKLFHSLTVAGIGFTISAIATAIVLTQQANQ